MEKQILQELIEIKVVLAKLVGTSELPPQEQFNIEVLNKAAKEFQELSIKRGNWVSDSDLNKHIKKAGYQSGKFIREEFGFTNYFKKGRTYYYNKKDLIDLNKELNDRNIDLGRYIELKESQEKFNRYLASAVDNNKGKGKKKSFRLPEGLKDILTSSPKAPSAEIIREDIKKLKEEFFEFKMSEYIDIYRDNHAMMKYMYYFEKYIEPGLKRRCKKWCEDFNYANHALELVTKKREKFIPVKDDDMIQL